MSADNVLFRDWVKVTVSFKQKDSYIRIKKETLMVEINKLLLGISQQTALDYVISIIIAILFMRGIHDLYLFAYKHRLAKVKNLEIFVDSWFSYKPNWVWVYVSLYPVIIISAYTTKSINQFTYSLFSYFILALILMIFYILFPFNFP